MLNCNGKLKFYVQKIQILSVFGNHRFLRCGLGSWLNSDGISWFDLIWNIHVSIGVTVNFTFTAFFAFCNFKITGIGVTCLLFDYKFRFHFLGLLNLVFSRSWENFGITYLIINRFISFITFLVVFYCWDFFSRLNLGHFIQFCLPLILLASCSTHNNCCNDDNKD